MTHSLAPAILLLCCLLPALLGLLGARYVLRHKTKRATQHTFEALELEPDEFAYLRGGVTGLARYHLAQLTARGWLTRCDEEGAFSSSISPCYRVATRHPSPALLRGASQELWLMITESALLTEANHLHELSQRLSPFGEAIHRKLARHGIVSSFEVMLAHRQRVALIQQAVALCGTIVCLMLWSTSHALTFFEAGLLLLVLTALQHLKRPERAWTREGSALVTRLEASYEPMRRAPWRWKIISSRDRYFLLSIHSSR